MLPASAVSGVGNKEVEEVKVERRRAVGREQSLARSCHGFHRYLVTSRTHLLVAHAAFCHIFPVTHLC